MFRSFLQGFVERGTTLFITQGFANHLALLCQQAYYNPYFRDALQQQIAAEIRSAFNNAPVSAHEQMAGDLLSALAQYPVHAGQLRLLGPEECARRYPIFAPVIYSIADMLIPGWNGSPVHVANPPPPLLPSKPASGRPPPTPALVAPSTVPLPVVPRSTPDSMKITPKPASTPKVDTLAQILADLQLPSPIKPHKDRPCDDNKLEAPEGMEDTARKINLLKYKNPAAYRRAVQKLGEAGDSGSTISTHARNWLNGFVRLPLWGEEHSSKNFTDAQQRTELRKAYEKLDAAASGHNEAKKRLMNRLALWLRNPDGPGLVLGIQGPPGNGKTSLVTRGLGAAMGRPVRVLDMGGVSDANKLRGDRSVWVSSCHGKISEFLMETGTTSIIIVLDEVDRVTNRGLQDVLSNLTDPNRNSQFEDNYFEGVPLDLSKTTIVCTFNEAGRLDSALKDRMGQIIYTQPLNSAEKTDVAKRFLIPAALKEVRRTGEVTFSDDAVRYLVALCSEDGGARGLKSYIELVVGTVSRTMIECEQHKAEVGEEQVRRICPQTRPPLPPRPRPPRSPHSPPHSASHPPPVNGIFSQPSFHMWSQNWSRPSDHETGAPVSVNENPYGRSEQCQQIRLANPSRCTDLETVLTDSHSHFPQIQRNASTDSRGTGPAQKTAGNDSFAFKPQNGQQSRGSTLDLGAYAARSPEEQRVFKKQLMEKVNERAKRIAEKMEKIEEMRRIRIDEPKSVNDARQEQVWNELLEKSEERDKVMRAAEFIFDNPGQKASDLTNIVKPLKTIIRDSAGGEVVEQLDTLLEQECSNEKDEGMSLAATRPGAKGLPEGLGEESDVAWEEEEAWRTGTGDEGETIYDVGDATYAEGRRKGDTGISDSATKAMLAHIHRLRQHRLYSRWGESRILSSSLSLKEKQHPLVAIQIGHNLMAQGYVEMALDVMDSSWFRWETLWHDHAMLKALRLARAFIRVLCQYNLTAALDEALSIHDLDSNRELVEAPSAAEVFFFVPHRS
jgi:ATPase family associated with various cellular activities (AAA)